MIATMFGLGIGELLVVLVIVLVVFGADLAVAFGDLLFNSRHFFG